jgi:hypothetical protein
MMGHRETAHRNFQKAVKLAPHDTFAQTMVHRSAGKPAAKG